MDQRSGSKRNGVMSRSLDLSLSSPFIYSVSGTYLYAAWTWIFYRNHCQCRRFPRSAWREAWMRVDDRTSRKIDEKRATKAVRGKTVFLFSLSLSLSLFLSDWRDGEIGFGWVVAEEKHRWRGLLRREFPSLPVYSSLRDRPVLINERFFRTERDIRKSRDFKTVGHYIKSMESLVNGGRASWLLFNFIARSFIPPSSTFEQGIPSPTTVRRIRFTCN